MGRGRGKGKKLTTTSHEDPGSGGEEPLPAYRRRGRPQKPLKDDIDEEEVEKIEEEEEEEGNGKLATPSKEMKGSAAMENGKKRKRYSQVKENSDSILEENSAGVRSNSEELTRTNGFRQNGSRRKSKPRRAAEAGVECK